MNNSEPAEEKPNPDSAKGGVGRANEAPIPEGAAERGGDLPADLASAYRKLLAEKTELYDRLLRKAAEAENFRKRVQKEKEEYLHHATADLVRALLPVLDSIERALKHRESSGAAEFHQGVELIHKQLLEVLGRAGVSPVETAGKLFDPHLHQAVETVEGSGHRDQEIVEELQRGYKFKHRLLRPAIVKVAVAGGKGKAAAHPDKKREGEE